MKTIPIASIFISPERQRRHFDPETLNTLREDIEQHGLFNAIVLRELPNQVLGLVQGERRLRAINDLYSLGGQLRYDGVELVSGSVPYTTLGELSPLLAELAELSENINRDDYTWQERAAATARIAAIRAEMALQSGSPPPTVADITKEVRDVSSYTAGLGSAQADTRKEIILAGLLGGDEDIRNAPTLREGWKIAVKKDQAKKNIALAVEVGKTFTFESHVAINNDAVEWLQEDCPSEVFDVILTDPPYGMGADEFGDSGGVAAGAHGYQDDYKHWRDLMELLPRELFRVAKPQSHCYLFCDLDRFHELKNLMTLAGWEVHRTPMIWFKPNGQRAPWASPHIYGPQRKYELILYAVKGKKPMISVTGDVLQYPSDTNLGNAAQKPVALFSDLLKRSIRPGDKVLDVCGGTGTVIPAAHELKCAATVIEKDKGQFGIILKRIEELRK